MKFRHRSILAVHLRSLSPNKSRGFPAAALLRPIFQANRRHRSLQSGLKLHIRVRSHLAFSGSNSVILVHGMSNGSEYQVSMNRLGELLRWTNKKQSHSICLHNCRSRSTSQCPGIRRKGRCPAAKMRPRIRCRNPFPRSPLSNPFSSSKVQKIISILSNILLSQAKSQGEFASDNQKWLKASRGLEPEGENEDADLGDKNKKQNTTRKRRRLDFFKW